MIHFMGADRKLDSACLVGLIELGRLWYGIDVAEGRGKMAKNKDNRWRGFMVKYQHEVCGGNSGGGISLVLRSFGGEGCRAAVAAVVV